MNSKNKPKTVVTFGDDDPHFMPSPCFQVSPTTKLKNVPLTGEEYILRILEEQKQCRMARLKADLEKYTNNQSIFCEELTMAHAPDEFKPTIEWQNIQVTDFSNVRMYIERMLAKYATSSSKAHYCKIKVKNWRRVFETEPTLSFAVELSQAVIDEGLEVLTSMLKKIKPGESVDHKTGQWIYTLLAVTRFPHLSDTTSILRALARECALVRFLIDPDSNTARVDIIPLNIFICLVGRYFKQFDLADKF